MSEKNNPKVLNGWAFYDWANSVFSLTITTAIFPPFYESISEQHAKLHHTLIDGVAYIDIAGFRLVNSALYSYALSFSFLLVAIISPILSGIADVRSNKKFFMQFFCYLGSASCMSMYFISPYHILLALLLFVISLLGFAGSIVFYNAFLPEIATEDKFDKLSAKGFSLGYIGSVILLLINLFTILFPQAIFPVQSYAQELLASGVSNMEIAMTQAKDHYAGEATRLSFVSVGLWWAGFAQITFSRLKENKKSTPLSINLFTKGLHEIVKVAKEISKQPILKKYLIGFFFTSMGLQTVMYVASLFGSQELHLPTEKLIITILIIQLIAIAGAWLFSRVSAIIGNIYSLVIMIIVWIAICFAAYEVNTEVQFYLLGALVGVVMGGIQSLFRSTYAKLIPDNTNDHASYFSFYDVCEKLAIVFGTFSYGLILDLTGTMRKSVLVLAAYFVIGLIWIILIRNFKQYKSQVNE